MSVLRDFTLTVVKKDSLVSVVSEVKQRSERSQGFPFDSSDVKQRSEISQRFPFNSSEAKQRSEHSQRIHFNTSESKITVVSVVRYFILVATK